MLKTANRVIINGKNYLNHNSLSQMFEALESGRVIEVYIDCIGHTRNNYEQENYRKELIKKYGVKLEIELINGTYSYSYCYRLKEA